MFYTSGKVSTIYSVVLADDVFQFFMKYSYVRVLLIHGGAVKKHLATGHSSTKKSNSNNLEPPFPATKSRSLRTREDTKTAVASPHCNESTRNSIPGWSTLLMEVTPELWRSYGTSYIIKTDVEVLLVLDFSGKSALQIFFVGDLTQVLLPRALFILGNYRYR